MDRLNGVDEFRNAISRELPTAFVEVDRPDNVNGIWWMDVSWNDTSAIVEWRPKLGYGVSFDPLGYGEGAENIYDSAEAAARAVADSLRARQPIDRVLLLTEDESLREDLARELRRRNIEIVVVTTTSDARAQISAAPFDLLMLDVSELDQVLVAAITSRHQPRMDPPITFVISTSFANLSAEVVHGVFRKPIEIGTLADILQASLRLRHRDTASVRLSDDYGDESRPTLPRR